MQAFKWAFIGRDEFFRRKEYWMFTFFHAILSALVMVVIFVMNVTLFLFYFYILAVYTPSLALLVRRLYDAEHSK